MSLTSYPSSSDRKRIRGVKTDVAGENILLGESSPIAPSPTINMIMIMMIGCNRLVRLYRILT